MKKIIFILPVTLLLFSCASLKTIKKNEVFQSDFAVKISGKQIDNFQIRIKRSEQIWIDFKFLGASVARAKIDKDSIRYYDNISSRYNALTWKDLNLPKQVNYNIIEKVLLGEKELKHKNVKLQTQKNSEGLPTEITVLKEEKALLSIIYKNPKKTQDLEIPFNPPKKATKNSTNLEGLTMENILESLLD